MLGDPIVPTHAKASRASQIVATPSLPAEKNLPPACLVVDKERLVRVLDKLVD